MGAADEARALARLVSEGDFSASEALVSLLRRLGFAGDAESFRMAIGLRDIAPWAYEHDQSGIVHLAWLEPIPPVMFGVDDRTSVHYMLLCGGRIHPGYLRKRKHITEVPHKLCLRCRRVLLRRVPAGGL